MQGDRVHERRRKKWHDVMRMLLRDVRYGIRVLARSPGFAAAAVITLALGIGANTAIFSVINGVLLKPLGYPEPDGLVGLSTSNAKLGMSRLTISYPNFLDWREQSTSFVDMGVYGFRACNVTGGGYPERALTVRASAGLLPVLGFDATLGRVFGPEAELPGGGEVVLLSHSFWQGRFGGKQDVVGETILLDNVPHDILGILPPELEHAWTRFDIWSPLPRETETLGRGDRAFKAYGRLKPGVTVAKAQAELRLVAERLADAYPMWNEGYTIDVVPMKEIMVGEAAKPTCTILMAVVVFVLLIACTNVGSLLLVRIHGRKKELAVRAALGAGRGRLAAQLIMECLLLTLIGGALGVLLAVWGLDLLTTVLSANVGRMGDVNIDGRVLLFALGLSLLTAVALGIVLGLRTLHGSPLDTLKGGISSTGSGKATSAKQDAIIAIQVSMALALSVCTGLMIRSLFALRSVDPGFDTSRLLTMRVTLPDERYSGDDPRRVFARTLTQRLSAIPGVESTALLTDLPLTGDQSVSGVTIEEFSDPAIEPLFVGDSVVSSDYFETMGIPLSSGRFFTEADNEHSPGVIIVNKFLAERFWRGEDPIGKRLKFDIRESATPWLTVVGVVGDVRGVNLSHGVRWETYRPFAQLPQSRLALAIRTRCDPNAVTTAVRGAVGEIDPDLALYEVRAMKELAADNGRSMEAMAGLLVVFAMTAITLAAVGLYGVVSFAVSRRTHEIGIRMALGANSGGVVRLILKRFMTLVLIGVLGGIVLALLLVGALAPLLFGVSQTDPMVMGIVGILMIMVSLLASYLPARRASNVDPMVALRCE